MDEFQENETTDRFKKFKNLSVLARSKELSNKIAKSLIFTNNNDKINTIVPSIFMKPNQIPNESSSTNYPLHFLQKQQIQKFS